MSKQSDDAREEFERLVRRVVVGGVAGAVFFALVFAALAWRV